jgi:hypothetical protein
MIGNLIAFAVSRVATRTVNSLERKIIWSVIGGLFVAAALTFTLLSAFWGLQAYIGSLRAAGVLALASVLFGVIGFRMPLLLNWLGRQARSAEVAESSVSEIAETIDEEAQAAVDVLGPVQVVASAFMVGVSAGRSMRKQDNAQ